MFSRSAEYALRAVLYLAAQDPRARTTAQIARATKVPRPYLYKVLQALNRAALVESQRGLGGGIRLARPAAELTILEVVNAVDPIHRIKKCPLGLAAHGVNLCPLHRRMDQAIRLVEEAFRQSTVADLLAEPAPTLPTCQFPRAGSRSSTANPTASSKSTTTTKQANSRVRTP